MASVASGGGGGGGTGACAAVQVDKAQFDRVLPTHGVEVQAKTCNTLRALLKPHILRQKLQKPIIDVPGRPGMKRIVLAPTPDVGATATPEEALAHLSADAQAFIAEHDLAVVPHEVHEGYANLSAVEVLRRLLPAGVEPPSSFESVGHLAHFNLLDELLPHRYLIGAVFLEKSNRQITTIVNKTGIIESVYRTFPLEVIAGDPSTLVEVSESGARFRFDYATVYWNSRLQYEHKRLVGAFKPSDVVCDMMCGIGPFAIPAAMKGCRVYANDLNPESYKYLLQNIKLNKVGHKVTPSNLCAREFMRGLLQKGKKGDFTCTRVVMNLPDTAIEFLDVFRGGWPLPTPPPIVSTYCFSKAVETPGTFKDDIVSRVEAVLGVPLDHSTTYVRDVRDVAPNKHMGCATFVLPRVQTPAGAGESSCGAAAAAAAAAAVATAHGGDAATAAAEAEAPAHKKARRTSDDATGAPATE